MISFDKNHRFFSSSKINSINIHSGFSTKVQGDTRKDEKLVSFFQKQNISHNSIVRANQTHSTNIEVIQTIPQKKIYSVDNVDGLITKEENIILNVMTADCVPIIFVDKKNGVIGVSHQGWKGTLERMAQKMVERMCEIGAEKEEIIAAIGPAIGSCCYEVYGERLQMFKKEFVILHGNTGFIQKRDGKNFLSLNYLNYLQLLETGLRKQNIDCAPFCTKCDEKRFFSYQRDTKDTFGQMVHFVMMYTVNSTYL